MKKKRGREGGRKKIKNSVFASVSAAFSLVSSLSSSYVFVVAQPGGGGAAGETRTTGRVREDTGRDEDTISLGSRVLRAKEF